MGVIYFSIPLIFGYFVTEAISNVSEKKSLEYRQKIADGTVTVPQHVIDQNTRYFGIGLCRR